MSISGRLSAEDDDDKGVIEIHAILRIYVTLVVF